MHRFNKPLTLALRFLLCVYKNIPVLETKCQFRCWIPHGQVANKGFSFFEDGIDGFFSL
jgi:hypothetical protein